VRSRSHAGHRSLLLPGVILVGVIVAGLVFATTRSAGNGGHATGQARATLIAAVSTIPADHASGVAPDAPVIVNTRLGRLLSVRVTPNGGQALTGTFSFGATYWTATAPLVASTSYQIRARVVGRSGVITVTTSTFTTLTPAASVTVTVWPQSGLTVGVGQPIVLKFSQPVTDPTARDRLLPHLTVGLSMPVAIGAYWFSSTELHLRPQSYWQTGEKVSFAASLDGWAAGEGAWGRGSLTVTFTVGDARISTVDLASHQMTVTDNGAIVATYPISAGSDQYPTMDGTHIVLDRESQVQMVSSTVGIPVDSPGGYDETVYWDVHISDSGEYVHAAPWSANAQGNTNVSHGCVNLSPADAEQFMNFSRVGDIVDVIDGSRAPVPGDHGVMDWSTPWSAFTPLTVSTLSG